LLVLISDLALGLGPFSARDFSALEPRTPTIFCPRDLDFPARSPGCVLPGQIPAHRCDPFSQPDSSARWRSCLAKPCTKARAESFLSSAVPLEFGFFRLGVVCLVGFGLVFPFPRQGRGQFSSKFFLPQSFLPASYFLLFQRPSGLWRVHQLGSGSNLSFAHIRLCTCSCFGPRR
jgi:hypothetical protein